MLRAPFVAGPVASQPMKSVNWNKLPMRKLGKSIWSAEPAEGAESIKIDTDLLDHFFTDFPKIKKDEERLAGSGADGGKKAEEKKADEWIKFLDPRRAQNIAIVSSSIKAAASELREALEAADAAVLTPEVVERLMSLCPIEKSELTSCTEQAALAEKGECDLTKLDRAERYLFELAKIDGLEGRLRCLHLQQHFGEWSSHCEGSMSTLITACNEVSTSTSLPVLLRYILSAGNYLNSGTLASHRKNAKGVKLDFLLELQKTTTRGHPKMKKIVTFLQLMQLQISEQAPTTDLWTAELPSLEEATQVDLSSITQDMERIGEGVGELAKNLKEISEGEAAAAIAAAKEAGEAGLGCYSVEEICSGEFGVEYSPFVVRLTAFEAEMKEKASALAGKKSEMDLALKGMAEMFGEEADNVAWVMRTLHGFAKQYAMATEANKTINENMAGR